MPLVEPVMTAERDVRVMVWLLSLGLGLGLGLVLGLGLGKLAVRMERIIMQCTKKAMGKSPMTVEFLRWASYNKV